MSDDDVRVFRLGFKMSPVVLTLALCPDCIRQRLNAEASILEKSRPAFPVPCVDCERKQGRLR